MKQKILSLTLVIALFVGTGTAFAAAHNVIFWYPGEAGTTLEAQPILDEFLEYVSGKLKTSKLTGKYFNTTDGGISFISGSRPTIGIISYSAWESTKTRFPNASVWLATNPLPHGQKQETYELVSKGPLPAGPVAVYSSEPLSAEFIKDKLGFATLKEFKPQQTPQILSKIKSIAEGKTPGAAILSPTEAATLAKMSASWTRSLQVVARSKPVPTARVVLFGSLPADATNLKQVFLDLRNDPEVKDILTELRLVGFSEP